MRNKRDKNLKQRGITLIALVVTVVVLLILAGVTITLMFGDNNIFDLAKDAAEKTNQAVKDDLAQIDELNKWLTENGYDSENGGSSGGEEEPETPTIPEGLEVGSSVTYNLVGDEYFWNNEYASSDQIGEVTLSSKTGGEFRITEWKVLAIDETTKEVTLVPTTPTIGTVRLNGAQGYNNAVKLLNDACSRLYGNEAKGITARSIKIEDIEDLMTETALTEAHSYAIATTYGNQVSNAYSSANSKYPVIYAQEKSSVIDGEEKATGLDLSDTPSNFIARSEGTSTTSSIGAITTATSIQPYQTYWYKNNSFMQTAFKSYKGENTYYNLIMPQGSSTTYWVASRFVTTYPSYCFFYVRVVYSGRMDTSDLYDSRDIAGTLRNSFALFPVVTLSSELIKKSTGESFAVQLEE